MSCVCVVDRCMAGITDRAFCLLRAGTHGMVFSRPTLTRGRLSAESKFLEIGYLFGWLVGKLVGWLVCGWVDWLVSLLVN